MRPNGVTLGQMADGTNNRASHGWIRVALQNWNGVDAKGITVGHKVDVVGLTGFRNRNAIIVARFYWKRQRILVLARWVRWKRKAAGFIV